MSLSLRQLLAYAKVFRAWRGGRESLDYLPEDVSIELTNTCNFTCAFCPQSDPDHFTRVARTTLSPDQADVILRRLREGGVRTEVLHWTLDGEPFINRDLEEICRRAMAHGFRTFIFSTNGYFLSADRLEGLPTGPGATYTLCTDFCADEEYFETYRGTKTSWKRVRDNLSAALDRPDLAHVTFQITDISGYTVDDPAEVARRADRLREMFPQSRATIHTRVFHNMTGYVPDILGRKQASSRGYNLCPYPWTSLVVASNGDVVACCRDLEHKTVLGNLFTEELPAVWNGERYRELRRNLAAGNPAASAACRGCDLPYDQAKFSPRNLLKTAVHRLGIGR